MKKLKHYKRAAAFALRKEHVFVVRIADIFLYFQV